MFRTAKLIYRMDLEYTAAEESFRAEVRQFIHENLPRAVSAKVLGHKRLTREIGRAHV